MPDKKLSVVPPEVTEENLDDFLVTDDLFVEYFNAFLQLPTFPEPVIFNKSSGGFEVVSNAKQSLKARIRTLVRSQQKPNHIYAAATRVSSARQKPSAQPMSMKEDKEMEFKTSFTILCLNKDQGIHWIKEERLPTFLQSDTYLEYRLAKIIAQTEVAPKESDAPLNLLIDLNYKPWAVKKPPIIEPLKVDEQALAMRNMFVCMGESSTTQTKMWFNDVKITDETRITSASSCKSRSSTGHLLNSDFGSRPCSARPVSVTSLKASVDSGFPRSPSPRRTDFDLLNETFDDIPNSERMFHSPPRLRSPHVWRAPVGDDCCVMAEDVSDRSYVGPVHVDVVEATKNIAANGETRETDREDVARFDNISEVIVESGLNVQSQQNDSGNEDDVAEIEIIRPKVLQVTTMDRMATFIIAYTLKIALRAVYPDVPRDDIDNIVNQDVLKSESINCADLTAESIQNFQLQYMSESAENTLQGLLKTSDELAQCISNPTTVTALGMPDTSEVDSLFDSKDDDIEEDSSYCGKQKITFDLKTKKGVDAFKQFLWGTQGEKCWNLWLDIDRGRQIKDPQTQLSFLSQLRDKYTKSGSQCEIPREMMQRLGLGDPSKWTSLERLGSLHYKIAEPLLLYWAPRFLMQETYKSGSINNVVYHYQKLLDKLNPTSYPEPKTVTLLPLRPKSCWPRLRSSAPSDFTNDKQQPRPHPAKPTTYPKALPIIPLSSVMTTITPKQPTPISKAAAPSTARKEHLFIGSSKAKHRRPSKSAPPVLRTASEILETRSVSNQGGWEFCQRSSVSPYSVEFGDEDIFDDYGGGDAFDQLDQSFKSSRTRSRPCSASSSISSTSTIESELFGGFRMESLLQGLYHEKKSGGFFMGYLERLGNQTYINALNCWHELQEYHAMFYADVFNKYVLARKAQVINSKYIVERCFYSIQCSPSLRNLIYREVHPPFEELYDLAEEHILELLKTPWAGMKTSDKLLFDKITLIQEERQLDVQQSKYLRRLTRKNEGFQRFNAFEFEADDKEAKRESYYELLQEKIPETFKDYDFNNLIHNRMEVEHFQQFLEENYAITDLMCWLDIETFRRMPHHDLETRNNKSKEIKTKYLNKKYFFGPNSPATRQEQHSVMQAGGGWGKLLLDRLPDAILVEVQTYVREKLARKWLPLFIATEEFQERQKANFKIEDIADDMLSAKRSKCMAISKILESKWVSSSADIIAFRHALSNPVTCAHYRKYVSLKGQNFENDVLFWLEVQKFKDMCHNHTEESLIQQKIQAIVNCFINSEIPPHLHIDITAEQAEKIVDKPSREMVPYVFREAQMTVFKVLYQQWADFQKYQNDLTEEKMLGDLERKRQKQKRKEKELRRLEEEKEAKKLDGFNTNDSARKQSIGINSMFFDILGDEEDKEDEIKGQEKYEWRYSKYVDAIKREEQLFIREDKASSTMSVVSNIPYGQVEGLNDRKVKDEGEGKVKGKSQSEGKNSVTPHPPSNSLSYQEKPPKKVSLVISQKHDGQEFIISPPAGEDAAGRRNSLLKGYKVMAEASTKKLRWQDIGYIKHPRISSIPPTFDSQIS